MDEEIKIVRRKTVPDTLIFAVLMALLLGLVGPTSVVAVVYLVVVWVGLVVFYHFTKGWVRR